MKDVEVERLPWTLWVGPVCDHRCLCDEDRMRQVEMGHTEDTVT